MKKRFAICLCLFIYFYYISYVIFTYCNIQVYIRTKQIMARYHIAYLVNSVPWDEYQHNRNNRQSQHAVSTVNPIAGDFSD